MTRDAAAGARVGATVLGRMVRPAPDPLTPARALRLALARAAERSVGLSLAVGGVAEEVGPLDDLLGRLEDDLLLLSLRQDGEVVGAIGLDHEATAAAIEAQTAGRLSSHPAEARAPTAADAVLVEPLATAFLREAAAATAGTALDGWIGAAAPGARFGGARDAGLALADGTYRAVRLSVDLRAGPRAGLLVLLVRLPPPRVEPEPAPAWADGLSALVLSAPAPVSAVLGRLRLPLDEAEALDVGQVLALPGLSVSSVRLEAPGGRDMGPARLGQSGGMRALRLGPQPAPELREMRPAAVLPSALSSP